MGEASSISLMFTRYECFCEAVVGLTTDESPASNHWLEGAAAVWISFEKHERSSSIAIDSMATQQMETGAV